MNSLWLLFVPTNHITRIASRVALRRTPYSRRKWTHINARSTYTIVSISVSVTQLLWTNQAKQAVELLMCLVWVCKTTEEEEKLTVQWFTDFVGDKKKKKTFCCEEQPVNKAVSQLTLQAERLTVWLFKHAEVSYNTVGVNFRYANNSGSSLRYIKTRRCGGDAAPRGDVLHIYKYIYLSLKRWSWHSMNYILCLSIFRSVKNSRNVSVVFSLTAFFVDVIQGSHLAHSFILLCFWLIVVLQSYMQLFFYFLSCLHFAFHFNVISLVAYSGDVSAVLMNKSDLM